MLKGLDGDMIGYTFENFHPKYDSINELTGPESCKAKLFKQTAGKQTVRLVWFSRC